MLLRTQYNAYLMGKKSYELIEHLTGVGSLHQVDKEPIAVEYDIKVFQEVSQARDRRVKGMLDVRGHISPIVENPEIWLIEAVNIERTYTLEIADGRRMKLSVSDNHGNIAACSDLI